MKPREEWPIAPNSGEAKVGEFIVVLDHVNDASGNPYTTMRIHKRISDKGSGELPYTAIDHRTLTPIGHREHRDIQERDPAYKKLEPLMNLLGTVPSEGFCPAFVITEEELRTVLGIEDGGES